jgi:NADH-quinone oxidoreductase subunit M
MPAILLQIVIVPAIAAILIFALRFRLGYKAGYVAVASLMYTTVLLVLAGIRVWNGEVLTEEYMLVEPAIRLGFLADGLSLPTALVINILCTALGTYSIHYVHHRIEVLYPAVSKRTEHSFYARFFSLFLFFPMGFMGVSLSTNLVEMYFFLEVLTITLYFLMAWFGYRQRVRVAFICLAWGIISALFFLASSLLIYAEIGTLEISAIQSLTGTPLAAWVAALYLLGLASKLAIVPLHVWMPWVHAEHPTCIAGLLAVYANLALYVLIRLVVIPLRADIGVFGQPIMVLALITMVYGSLLTMAQTDIKRLAACSTISQIAYSVLGLGALTQVSIEGGMFFFLSHIMGKTIFFSTAGIVVYITGVRDMNQMGGLAQKMPLTAVLWVMGAMMLSGFPPFSSFTAEWIMFTGIFERGVLSSPFGITVAILGILAILLTVGYTFNGMRKIFFGPLSPTMASKQLKDPPLLMSIPLLIVAGCSIVLGLYPRLVLEFFHKVLHVL